MKNYFKKIVQLIALSVFTTFSMKGQSASIFKKFDNYQTLTQTWELEPDSTSETFLITAYKPTYILPFRFSSHRREVNFEVVPVDNGATEEEIQLDNVEATMQFSFKTKLAQRIFGHGALWLGYTQKSYWQVYNAEFSRPFRETNYEPEIIFNYPVKFEFLKMKMLGFGFNHQSNGREGHKFTRSWNRFILHAGFENKQWSLLVRTWFATEITENPDIEDYMGRADFTFNYRLNKYLLTLKAQHSLRFGDDNHGNVEVDCAFPIYRNLKGYFQFFHGYGDAMIDYNQIHTIAGIGIVFAGTL
ncbi:phospholipase A [Flavobacterium taihuense]|uniref:Phospholipase A n=1 Tax=Flavobacterium taihuense TaxID=2857508 RepID=A0ABS6XY65_9FLAO|nr:phospholipase A [Flavobacterium taihuense]MBW4361602.1 phospholipase A [Flavobacterium taihuense]